MFSFFLFRKQNIAFSLYWEETGVLQAKEVQKITQLIENRFTSLSQRIKKLEQEISDLQEDSKITRSSVNVLLEWADDASIQTVRLLDRKSK